MKRGMIPSTVAVGLMLVCSSRPFSSCLSFAAHISNRLAKLAKYLKFLLVTFHNERMFFTPLRVVYSFSFQHFD